VAGLVAASEHLSDPNILSFPGAGALAHRDSLQAGFMEECVFRAIPLALGALIASASDTGRVGIAYSFVIQALVFGGAHAN